MVYVMYVINFFRLSINKIILRKNISFNLLERIHIFTRIFIHKGGVLEVGRNVEIEKNGKIVIGKSAKLHIGNSVYMNQNVNIGCLQEISIEDNCIFGPNVCIYDNNHKFSKDEISNTDYSTDKISIGKSSWIGANVIILKGSTIGKHCVIGAGCVISNSIPDYSIVSQERILLVNSMR